ncbi:general stress protein [Filibacter tadaridae]|uniref:Heat induced stress protein YflT n=1 Tax=Filibacter tadaridae TaxID=2483811 RepID=A0A3P5XL33_9BACL|nr:general stress protein [Filibacter tadaridae]VDC29476.1 Heat induced stress protein YflT [Filibacter tadaridae]
MADKKFVGTYNLEGQVLDEIAELKLQGYSENDMYVITNDKDTLKIVRGLTDVELRTSEDNWFDRFKAFLNGDEPVMQVFSQMGFTEDESSRYYDEVKNGSILLYVEKEEVKTLDDTQLNFREGYIDPNIGSNLIIADNTAAIPTATQGTAMNSTVNGELQLDDNRPYVVKDSIDPGNSMTGREETNTIAEKEEVVNDFDGTENKPLDEDWSERNRMNYGEPNNPDRY